MHNSSCSISKRCNDEYEVRQSVGITLHLISPYTPGGTNATFHPKHIVAFRWGGEQWIAFLLLFSYSSTSHSFMTATSNSGQQATHMFSQWSLRAVTDWKQKRACCSSLFFPPCHYCASHPTSLYFFFFFLNSICSTINIVHTAQWPPSSFLLPWWVILQLFPMMSNQKEIFFKKMALQASVTNLRICHGFANNIFFYYLYNQPKVQAVKLVLKVPPQLTQPQWPQRTHFCSIPGFTSSVSLVLGGRGMAR